MAEISSNDETRDGQRMDMGHSHPGEGKTELNAPEPTTGSSNEDVTEEVKKSSKLNKIWGKLGLDAGTLMLMFKGSLAPTIAIAFYQADSVAATYGTLGYLVPIISVLSIPIMPRAKYFQTLILNIIGICTGSAVALLGVWSGVQARLNTTSASGATQRYNSSQAAVCAIWLFANIWFVNTLREKMPALQFPVILYSIFTNISFTYGPSFQTIAQGEALIKQLLIGFLTAFGLSTGVHLFVIPMSSRLVVFKEQAGCIELIRTTLRAQGAYLQNLESSDMFGGATCASDVPEAVNGHSGTKNKNKNKIIENTGHPADSLQSKALKKAVTALTSLHGKLEGDIPFAKRESAWGKLDAKDIDQIYSLLRGIIIPLIGMSTVSDIFERIAERRGWVKPRQPHHKDKSESWEQCSEADKLAEQKTWNEVMKALHAPFAVAVSAMDEGLQHAGLILEILPRPKRKTGTDEEDHDNSKPGGPGFADFMEKKMKTFYSKRGEILRAWGREKGLSKAQFDNSSVPALGANEYTPDEAQHRRDQQQLYLILYMEHLLFSTGLAITALVKFADKKNADGTMKKNRLLLPGQRRLKKWIFSIAHEDNPVNAESPDELKFTANTIYMGTAFNKKKDPEHLPPRTAWEKFGNGLRTVPRFLGSAESSHGFRVACATLTIGIMAFLKDTQVFFMAQRLVWAMIIIAIGMSMTSGQSMFGFFGRVGGTTVAMITSMVAWYIVDEKTPGVIVMLWFFIFIEMYFFIKFPRFIQVWLIAIVTQVLIIGYELQVGKIGVARSTASGQPYYPIYELAPYRLATVAGGSFVAFIWTVFPYPISDRSWLRKDLGSALYLLANYYSVIHSTIGARVHNTEGDRAVKTSPGRRLEKARHKILGKLMVVLPSLERHADWQKWEISIGGKFPRETYDCIILRVNNISNYLSLMSYATQSWSQDSEALYPNTTAEGRRAWLNDLSALLESIGPTSHQITSVLSLLSASVKEGLALPPHIQLPPPYNLSRRLEALDKGILDSRHVEEPGYSAYAVLQVASSLITDDLARLVDHVRDLVGETDFSFTVKDSESSLGSQEEKGKRD